MLADRLREDIFSHVNWIPREYISTSRARMLMAMIVRRQCDVKQGR